jgi:hypothetical protein
MERNFEDEGFSASAAMLGEERSGMFQLAVAGDAGTMVAVGDTRYQSNGVNQGRACLIGGGGSYVASVDGSADRFVDGRPGRLDIRAGARSRSRFHESLTAQAWINASHGWDTDVPDASFPPISRQFWTRGCDTTAADVTASARASPGFSLFASGSKTQAAVNIRAAQDQYWTVHTNVTAHQSMHGDMTDIHTVITSPHKRHPNLQGAFAAEFNATLQDLAADWRLNVVAAALDRSSNPAVPRSAGALAGHGTLMQLQLESAWPKTRTGRRDAKLQLRAVDVPDERNLPWLSLDTDWRGMRHLNDAWEEEISADVHVGSDQCSEMRMQTTARYQHMLDGHRVQADGRVRMATCSAKWQYTDSWYWYNNRYYYYWNPVLVVTPRIIDAAARTHAHVPGHGGDPIRVGVLLQAAQHNQFGLQLEDASDAVELGAAVEMLPQLYMPSQQVSPANGEASVAWYRYTEAAGALYWGSAQDMCLW